MIAGTVCAAAPCAAEDATALARAGTAAIESGRFGDALQAFTEAAGMQPDDASLCFGAGIAAFMLGKDEIAQARFECTLALTPSFLPAAVWLGDLHYRAGRLSEAISIYEAAARRSPLSRDLQQQLDEWRKQRELQTRFQETRTEHFTVLFEMAADEPLARKVTERLEAAHRRIGNTLGIYPSRPVTVVLYTREQFSDITKLAAWSVAAFDGRIRLPLAVAAGQPEELDRVLSHEYAHAVIAMLGGRTVPAWLDEGLATVLEPEGAEDAEAPPGGTRERLALSRLHRGFVSLSTPDAEAAYATAAHGVRRLIELRGVNAIVGLLEDLGHGVPFDRAFQQRLAMRYEDFDALAVSAPGNAQQRTNGRETALRSTDFRTR
jgi:tetratricopeptide (TPR) repeat protein